MLDRFADFVAGITECHRHIQRIKTMEMTEFGLKGNHVMCLFYLGRSEAGLTAAQLCSLCCEDKAAISRTLAELESKGYIQNAEPGKKYRAPLVLTDSGVAVTKRIEGLVEQWVTLGGDGLTDEERTAFYATLGKIAANLRENVSKGN